MYHEAAESRKVIIIFILMAVVTMACINNLEKKDSMASESKSSLIERQVLAIHPESGICIGVSPRDQITIYPDKACKTSDTAPPNWVEITINNIYFEQHSQYEICFAIAAFSKDIDTVPCEKVGKFLVK